MKGEDFKFEVAIDDKYITVIWTRLPYVTSTLPFSRYPKFQMRFNYRDISSDTVSAMLRDMEVPDRLSKAIMTRIAANAT